MQNQPLSAEEIQHMRQILAQHDAESKPVQTFDLNNPPRQTYVFQKFPMMVYATDGEGHLVVSSEAELSAALKQGFTRTAPAQSEVALPKLSASLQAEADRVQEQLEANRRAAAVRRGPGRPAEAA